MRGTKSKIIRKEKVRDFEQRRGAMLKALKELSELYRIDLQGALQFSPQGIIPMVAFIDVIDQYEKVVTDKSNGELKRPEQLKI